MSKPNLQQLASHPRVFRHHVRIATDAGPMPFDVSAEPWQLADFEPLDDAWRAVVGFPVKPSTTRLWAERPRGHSKSSDIALSVSWALWAAPHKITGVAAACDKDQAGILRDSIQSVVSANSWLNQFLQVQRERVVNRRTGSEMKIISGDVASSFGELVDFVVVDEVSHWPKRELFDSLLTTAGKKKHCVMMCILNAGWTATWPYQVREIIRQDSRWHFSHLDGPHASWLLPESLEEQRRILPRLTYERLVLNRWIAGSGDAFEPEWIDSAITRGESAEPVDTSSDEWAYYGGFDAGVKRDFSALAIIRVHCGATRERIVTSDAPDVPPAFLAADDLGLIDLALPPSRTIEYDTLQATRAIELVHLQVWRPGPGRPVNLDDVESAILRCNGQYPLAGVWYDPVHAHQLASHCVDAGVAMHETPFGGGTKNTMASSMIDAFSENHITLRRDAAEPEDFDLLIQDLRNARIEEKRSGTIALESPRGPSGHGDTVAALALATLAAKRQEIQPATVKGPLIVG